VTNEERVVVLKQAMDHQYDKDGNAELAIATTDPILIAAVALVNQFGSYSEIVVSPSPEFIDAIECVLSLGTVKASR